MTSRRLRNAANTITHGDFEERAENDVRRAGVEPALHEAGGLQPLGHTNAQPTHFPSGSHCDPQVLGSDFLKLLVSNDEGRRS